MKEAASGEFPPNLAMLGQPLTDFVGLFRGNRGGCLILCDHR